MMWFLGAYSTWDSLSFLDLWIYNSLNLEKCCLGSSDFFLSPPPPHPLFYDSNYTFTDHLIYVPQFTKALFLFLLLPLRPSSSFLFFLPSFLPSFIFFLYKNYLESFYCYLFRFTDYFLFSESSAVNHIQWGFCFCLFFHFKYDIFNSCLYIPFFFSLCSCFPLNLWACLQ